MAPRAGSVLYLDKIQLKSQPLGVSILNVTNNTLVYPDPATDMLNILFSNDLEGQAILKVYDMNGRVVLARCYNSGAFSATVTNKITIPVGQLTAGLYYFTVSNNGAQISNKFIKQ
jgi:hypothetical protein